MCTMWRARGYVEVFLWMGVCRWGLVGDGGDCGKVM